MLYNQRGIKQISIGLIRHHEKDNHYHISTRCLYRSTYRGRVNLHRSRRSRDLCGLGTSDDEGTHQDHPGTGIT